MSSPVLVLRDIKRTMQSGGRPLKILSHVNLTINKGEIVALTGPSGSGKSTLLYMAGLLDQPSGGRIIVNNVDCSKMSENERTAMRRAYLGFVYQSHLLMSDFTALENVMIPQLIARVDAQQARQRAEELLARMGLKDRMHHRSGALSGGEQQRVAIARALANRPALLLADEPTGNLDPQTSNKVFNELLALVRETGLSALIATHNPALAEQMDRCVFLKNGTLFEGEA